MAKNKGSPVPKKQQLLISQQERTNNPIFRTVYKRIRNLNKKLTTIDSLLELDKATLKPEQIQKISSRGDVENEIRKAEEFAQFYKSILQQNFASAATIPTATAIPTAIPTDNKEDVVKIATLLVVGAGLPTCKTLDGLADIEKCYKAVVGKSKNGVKVQDRVSDVAALLQAFLKNASQYALLKSYAAENPAMEVTQVPAQKNNTEPKCQKKNEVKQEKEEVKKEQKPQIKPTVPVVTQNQRKKQQKPIENFTKETPKYVQKKIQPVPVPVPQVVEKVEKVEQVKQVQKLESAPVPVANPTPTSASQNPQIQVPQASQSKQQIKPEKEEQRPQKREYNPNRGYNKDHRAYNNTRNNYNPNRNSNYRRYENGDNYNNNSSNYNNNNSSYNNSYKARNEENRQKYEQRGRRNQRKGSDTSLEPTPEKVATTTTHTSNKVKYVSKN